MNTGGPAFPQNTKFVHAAGQEVHQGFVGGISIRDYFAAKAMAAFMNSKTAVQLDAAGYTATALVAYNMADAMLKRREK